MNNVLEIRPAKIGDAAQIAAVKQSVWPGEAANLAYIQQALSSDSHCAHVAVAENSVIGFASGFMTKTADGEPRWELDLLAVHPDFRGRGIAPLLISQNTAHGRGSGAKTARGLVHRENLPSQRSFARAGYRLDTESQALVVFRGAVCDGDFNQPDGIHIIPVKTMNYCGLWLEGKLSLVGLHYAQKVRQDHRLDLVGAVIPHSHSDVLRAATNAGFALIGSYQWWKLDFGEA